MNVGVKINCYVCNISNFNIQQPWFVGSWQVRIKSVYWGKYL